MQAQAISEILRRNESGFSIHFKRLFILFSLKKRLKKSDSIILERNCECGKEEETESKMEKPQGKNAFTHDQEERWSLLE